MKKLYILPVLLAGFSGLSLQGQTPTFSENVATILYNNCTVCHRTDGLAPFAIESYNDALIHSYSIANAVSTLQMPPWPPDPAYNHFVGERYLSPDEISTIMDWFNGGSPEGNPALAPAPPVFNDNEQLGIPDLTIKMQPYASTATTQDEYACFTYPAGLTQDKFVKAIEIIPGNRQIVHHVIVFLDPGATVANCMNAALQAQTMTGYAPGAPPTIFPNSDQLKLGMKMPAGSNIMLQMHYPQGTAGIIDSTKVNFYFYPDNTTGIREVTTGMYVGSPFIYIQPNTTVTLDGRYPYISGVLDKDYSLLSTFPHMHKVGRRMESFAVTPANDTIPLVRVNDWRFDWQGFYTYKKLVKVPAGSVLYGTAFYDNTANNPYNPFNPPQTITVGEQTTNEMMLISYQFMPYQAGDENYELDSMLTLSSGEISSSDFSSGFSVFPNPTTGELAVVAGSSGLEAAETEISVANVLGQTVYSVLSENMRQPLRISLAEHARGIYFVRIRQGKYSSVQKVVLGN